MAGEMERTDSTGQGPMIRLLQRIATLVLHESSRGYARTWFK